ncbi:MAG: hypothetical protein IKF35_10035 [Solobacterium sp.]|nr:hypothetical protein [Solobacterium sp.]
MKKNVKRIVYGIGMGLVWDAALTGMLNSPVGTVIGAGLGVLYAWMGSNAAKQDSRQKDS